MPTKIPDCRTIPRKFLLERRLVTLRYVLSTLRSRISACRGDDFLQLYSTFENFCLPRRRLLLLSTCITTSAMEKINLPFHIVVKIFEALSRSDAKLLVRSGAFFDATRAFRMVHGFGRTECWDCDNGHTVQDSSGLWTIYCGECRCPKEEEEATKSVLKRQKRSNRSFQHRIMYLNTY